MVSNFRNIIHRMVRQGQSDLTLRQLDVIFLCDAGDQTVRDMAAAMKVSKPAISRAVDKLAEAGYVLRQDDPHDRRSIYVRLSPAGKQFVSTFQ